MDEIANREWAWLKGEVRSAAAAFADQLRSVPDIAVRVPNLEWTVAELGAHVACLASLYRDQHRVGTAFQPPPDWRQFSADVRAHITTTDPHELADLIETQTVILLADGDDDPETQRWLYGQPSSPANTAAGYHTELILHGRDLGRLTGAKPKLTRRAALAGLKQQMALTSAFVDPAKAAKLTGTYGLHFRGGADYTFRVADGSIAVLPGRPDKADARINAAPEAFLMVSMGRMGNLHAGLLGKIIGYGRKPWRLIALGNVAVDGV